MSSRVTMSDVAREAGVSLMTVSRVINSLRLDEKKLIDILLRNGHKRIGMVSGPPASYGGAGRRRGFLAALREAGIELLEGRIRPGQPSVEGGHAVTRRLLGMYSRLTALFCFNDLVAVEAPQLLAISC